MNSTDFFYNGFNESRDEFLDPFDKTRKTAEKKTAPEVRNSKREHFETVVLQNILTIISVVMLGFLYIDCLKKMIYEYLRSSSTDLTVLSELTIIKMSAAALMVICIVSIGYYIIKAFVKAVKHKENISFKNTFIAAGAALMTDLAINLFNILPAPDKIAAGIVFAAVIIITVILLKKFSEKNDRKAAITVICSIFSMLIFFTLFSVMFSTVYNEGTDYNAKFFCIQNAPIEKSDGHFVSVPNSLMNKTYTDGMYYSTESAMPDRVFRTKGEVSTYFEEAEKLRIKNGCTGEVYDEIEASTQEMLAPELNKYDDAFFKDNVLIIISAINYCRIDNANIPQIYFKKSTDMTYFRFDTNDLPYTNYDDDFVGVCYALISVPKDKADIFSREIRLV